MNTTPILSIVIPTQNRPQLLRRAVESALAQSIADVEVIVVDDGSIDPVELTPDPRLQVIRLEQPTGVSKARNVGTAAARSRWIAYLDDDDRLLPQMADISLTALETADLPPPVGVLSSMHVMSPEGSVIATRVPPPLRLKGSHFSLEELESGYSYNTKQTLVVEKAVIQQVGGWDESFRSRVTSELFLRLNPACSLLGLPTVTYELWTHAGARISRNTSLRQISFQRLIDKHRSLFDAHPKMFADFVYEHACTSYRQGQKREAIAHFAWALRLDPLHTLARVAAR